MKRNVGARDRVLRAFLGVASLGWAAVRADLWSLLFVGVGVCFLLSASFGVCFGYRLCGISSCRIDPPAGGLTPP